VLGSSMYGAWKRPRLSYIAWRLGDPRPTLVNRCGISSSTSFSRTRFYGPAENTARWYINDTGSECHGYPMHKHSHKARETEAAEERAREVDKQTDA
jgi:hypothetical protein